MVDHPPVERLHPTAKLPDVVVRAEPLGNEPGHSSALVDSPPALGSPLQGWTRRRGPIESVPELVEEIGGHDGRRCRGNDLLGAVGSGVEHKGAQRLALQLRGVANASLALGVGAQFDP